ncbi:hypothetical protein ACE6HT_24625, partial [Citrobacter freundii]|uniref:hypothetical protein n=1 Tax=Citrobacter freundii TaxID=546 RepID=UPI0035D0AFB7
TGRLNNRQHRFVGLPALMRQSPLDIRHILSKKSLPSIAHLTRVDMRLLLLNLFARGQYVFVTDAPPGAP